METGRVVKIGLSFARVAYLSREQFLASLSDKDHHQGRILLTLRDYLVKHSKKFSDSILCFKDNSGGRLSNGTITGTIGHINRSEIDIEVRPMTMDDATTELVDFSYPFHLRTRTFMIQKPEYNPSLFGIFQIFSSPVWIGVISVLFAMSLVYCIHLKSNYRLDKIVLHVLAILLRQSSILRPSSIAEKILLYSWVLGAMFICLAYDSVFLSFMTFPPVIRIRHLSDLATAVKNSEYHCFTITNLPVYGLLLKSKQENLKVIATDILNNGIQYQDVFWDFLLERKRQNLAYFLDEDNIDYMTVGRKFVSEDRFLETMSAMMVRKNFCCKELLKTFVHRMMDSGLYFKIHSDSKFIRRTQLLHYYKFPETDTTKRKISLTDVAPAFIFLLAGYFISFVVLVVEIISDHRRKRKCLKKSKKGKRTSDEV